MTQATHQILDQATRDRIRAALTDPTLEISEGLGSVDGPRCTIAEINLILTGKLWDGPHPCMSEVIRRWVIGVQDAMPDAMRNAVQWREAASGIAGSAASEEVELARRDVILAWMWDALADEAVLASVPAQARPAWDAMLADRAARASAATYAAGRAYAAYAAAYAADDADDAADDADDADDAAYAADDAARATTYAATAAARATTYAATTAAASAAAAAASSAAYWARRNPAALLVQLIAMGGAA